MIGRLPDSHFLLHSQLSTGLVGLGLADRDTNRNCGLSLTMNTLPSPCLLLVVKVDR